MTAPVQNSITIYKRKNYQGTSMVFTRSRTDLRLKLLNAEKMSVKIKGNGSWTCYSKKHMDGKKFTLQPADYPNLDSIKDKGEYVLSLKADWETMDETDSDYPVGQEYDEQWAAIGAWFLGPKAENMPLMTELVTEALEAHGDFRNSYFPTDPDHITAEIKANPAYVSEVRQLRKELRKLYTELQNSVPLVSTRFQGHMNWDVSMASNLGYIAALLYNTNNVANEASPVTTRMEIEVGDQLCDMLGYDINGTPKPWGHITADGSIANIEAMWSMRNIKFYPLSVKQAIVENKGGLFDSVQNFKIKLANGTEQTLKSTDSWDLLNLDVDEIVRLPSEVASAAGMDSDEYSEIVDQNNLANLGWNDFMKKYSLDTSPVVLAPKSNHYSWPKAATLLGIGQSNLIGVEFDKSARMSIVHLKALLLQFLAQKVPIISVVCVLGTTEESAVDPISEVITLRDQMRKKGLNFAISADAAWGGYMCTMLHEKQPIVTPYSKYVPKTALSDYTKTQLLCIKHADSCTLDPHKSGFSPYPAGGLCYRTEKIRGFVKVKADVVYHAGDDPSIGVWGIEGSKPGAAAAGVLLAHRAIGLDKHGLGRVLGQCTFGAKLFYCRWLTLAKDNDNFICVPMKPLGDNQNLAQVKAYINNNIIGKTNEEITENEEVMEFLRSIGPDTLINAFAVNAKTNTNIDKANEINYDIFERTSHTNSKYDIKRVPMILTQSELPVMKFGSAVAQFKDRLNIIESPGQKKGLKFLINTVMNPWTTSNDGVEKIGALFRQITLNAIGDALDTASKHGFVVVGNITNGGEVFGDHLPMFGMADHQYHSVAKFQFQNQNAITEIKKRQKAGKTLTFLNEVGKQIGKLLLDGRDKPFEVSIYEGPPTPTSVPFLRNINVMVTDIVRSNHFDMTLTEYPESMSYLMYGDKNGTYLSHNITKKPDFFQVVKLDAIPHSVTSELTNLGIDIEIPDMSGTPLRINGKIADPLQGRQYTINCPSYNGETIGTTMHLSNSDAKIYFESETLNKAH